MARVRYFKNQSFQNISTIKVGVLIKYSSQKKNIWKNSTNSRRWKNLYESTKFAIFDKVVHHNFGKSDDVIT